VVIAVVLSLVILIVHIGDPPTSVLGRTPSGAWHDLERSAEARPVPGVVVWRQEAPLLFLNARRLSDRVRTLTDDPAVELLVADASGTTGIDTTGLSAFLTLRDELQTRGVELWLVRPLLRIEEKSAASLKELGAEMPPIFESLDEAIDTFERRT
jgi:MFS superfamily sulfate permease-like transporter